MFYPGSPLYFYRGLPVVPPPPSFNRGKTPEDTLRKIVRKVKTIIKLIKVFFSKREKVNKMG
jgi:hypothetical protein